eukprot:scaffold1803_cov150-Skeletonema_marinoi.AAC.15
MIDASTIPAKSQSNIVASKMKPIPPLQQYGTSDTNNTISNKSRVLRTPSPQSHIIKTDLAQQRAKI